MDDLLTRAGVAVEAIPADMVEPCDVARLCVQGDRVCDLPIVERWDEAQRYRAAFLAVAEAAYALGRGERHG